MEALPLPQGQVIGPLAVPGLPARLSLQSPSAVGVVPSISVDTVHFGDDYRSQIRWNRVLTLFGIPAAVLAVIFGTRGSDQLPMTQSPPSSYTSSSAPLRLNPTPDPLKATTRDYAAAAALVIADNGWGLPPEGPARNFVFRMLIGIYEKAGSPREASRAIYLAAHLPPENEFSLFPTDDIVANGDGMPLQNTAAKRAERLLAAMQRMERSVNWSRSVTDAALGNAGQYEEHGDHGWYFTIQQVLCPGTPFQNGEVFTTPAYDEGKNLNWRYTPRSDSGFTQGHANAAQVLGQNIGQWTVPNTIQTARGRIRIPYYVQGTGEEGGR